jgi:hypothetical protein
MMALMAHPDPSMTAEARAERLSGAIYGTVVVGGVLAATTHDAMPSAIDAGLYVLATVVVFWLAHAWARSMGRRATGERSLYLDAAEALAQDWPLVQAAFPPFVSIAAARALGASHETAIDIGLWTCVAQLAAWGAGIARREGASAFGIVLRAAGCMALGVLLVLLKALLS